MPNDTYENYGYPSAFAFRGRLGQPFQADEYNGMLVSDNLPQGTRICQSGRVYCISTAAGTAKAPVGTVGTTTAAFALWNGNAVTTKYCMVVTEVEARLVSGTAPVGSTMTLGLSSAVQGSAVSGYSGVVGPKSLSNSTGRTSQAVIGGAITLAGAPVWRGVASTTVALAVGGAMIYQPRIPIIIPPYTALGATVQSDSGTSPLWGWTFTYAEIELDLD
jgi:hypothetical protein